MSHDKRVAQMTVLFWGQLSEIIGQQLVERLGLTKDNLDSELGQGILDANIGYVYEFLSRFRGSDAELQIPTFISAVIELAKQAADSVDGKGGAP